MPNPGIKISCVFIIKTLLMRRLSVCEQEWIRTEYDTKNLIIKILGAKNETFCLPDFFKLDKMTSNSW